MLLLYKLYTYIIESKEIYLLTHFYLDVCYQKSFLKKSNFFQLVLKQKTCHNYLKVTR